MGGDGRILLVLRGDGLEDIGGNLLSVGYDCWCAGDGDCCPPMAEVKQSMGLASGGDIRLENGGRRVIFKHNNARQSKLRWMLV